MQGIQHTRPPKLALSIHCFKPRQRFIWFTFPPGLEGKAQCERVTVRDLVPRRLRGDVGVCRGGSR